MFFFCGEWGMGKMLSDQDFSWGTVGGELLNYTCIWDSFTLEDGKLQSSPSPIVCDD